MRKRLKSILVFVLAFSMLVSTNSFSLFAQGNSSQPNVSNVVGTLVSLSQTPNVTMDGNVVYGTHYTVTIDGIDYEAYCADPLLNGPEHTAAIYELKGQGSAQLKNVLKNGYTNNSEWSNANVDPDDRAWLRFITRVAVAMVNNPTRTFAGDNAVINRAQSLVDGSTTANTAAYPPIMVNGVKDAQDTGRTIYDTNARSQTFAITYNRKTNLFYNPFTFEWVAGTPAGAKLIVNGSVIATAPTNPTTVYRNNITSFTIEMPNTAAFDGKTAAVNLVGIHNHFADTIWLMQNATNPETWQDIVFYIPEVSASAAFSFIRAEDEPPPALIIKKISNTGALLNGAKFTVTGNGKNETITVNGEFTLELDDWANGTYTVTETVAPSGYELNASPQTFTISNNSVTPAELIFVNSPPDTPPPPTIPTLPSRDPRIAAPPAVRIQKIDALTRENIPDALIRLSGGSSFQMTTGDGQLWEIDNTGIDISVVLTAGHTLPVVPEPTEDGRPPVEFELIDGVLTIYNIPWGYYKVEEERAPQGYSLLPQHTAYSFWVLPPNVTVTAGLPSGDEESGEDESDGGGSIEYLIDEDENVNSILITFENYPFGSIELTKLDEITGEAVEGAIFRIEGYFPEGNENGIPTYRMDTTDASGKILWEDLPAGMYTITEVNAPEGYHTSKESVAVPLTWGQEATVIVTNKPYGSLEIFKVDELTGELIDGAVFEVEYLFDDMIMKTTVTTSSGRAELTGLPKSNVSIREIFTPHGYVPSNETYVYPIEWGQTTTVTITNTPKSSLEVLKIDGNSGAPLSGAVFELKDPTTGETWQATTGGDGIALLGQGSDGNELYPGRTYILTEIHAPEGYVLNTEPRQIVLSPGDNNRETVQNYKKPTLTITKYDELTGEPLAGATFRLWRTEGETWSENQITDANGRITWTDLDPGIYSIQEIDEPYGYFKDPARKEILLNGGDNKELTFFNRPRPVLIIQKRDAVTGEPLAGTVFRVQALEGLTVGEFITDANGMIELSPRTGYLLNGAIYRITEITPPANYLLGANPVKDVMLKWYEPTELIFENVLKPTIIFIKRDGMSGRGVPGATFRVQYESAGGGVTTLGSYITKCGIIVIPYVEPGWYIFTEISPAPGYSLPSNPTTRVYFAPGENSYTYAQTQVGLYADPRTNPLSGSRGMCGDCCGFLCSTLCAGNCGNPGDGTTSPGNTGGFGNITITNGNGDPLGNGTSTTTPTTPPANPGTNPIIPTLSFVSVMRNSDLTATVTFTSSIAGRYYSSVVNNGAAEPYIGTSSLGIVCSAGSNTITVYLTAGAKDLYIKVKDADGNVSESLKISIPAFSASAPASDPPPDFSNIKIEGGTVVYLNPDFAGITITFGNKENE